VLDEVKVRLAAKLNAIRHDARAAFAGALADQLALEFSNRRQEGRVQAPSYAECDGLLGQLVAVGPMQDLSMSTHFIALIRSAFAHVVAMQTEVECLLNVAGTQRRHTDVEQHRLRLTAQLHASFRVSTTGTLTARCSLSPS
jgi:hypothetical protein